MNEIRIGKDIAIVWTIKKGEDFVPLSERKLTVEMSCGTRKEVVPFRVLEDNKIAISYYGKDQKQTGIYNLTLWENFGAIGQCAVDKLAAFKLVPYSTMEKHEDAGELETATVEIETEDVVSGIRGLSAYEIAVQHGFVGTEEDWLDYLRKPSEDAAAGLDAKFLAEITKLKQDYDGKTAALKKDYDEKSAALKKSYEELSQSLANDYTGVKSALNSDYTTVKSKLDANYKEAVDLLAAAYAQKLKDIDAYYVKQLDNALSNINSQLRQTETNLNSKINQTKTDLTSAIATAKKTLETEISKTNDEIGKTNEEVVKTNTELANVKKNVVYRKTIKTV